jgi:predicted DNA-binding transcriptional regulator AlpA
MSERLTPANVAKQIGITEYTMLDWMRKRKGPAFTRLTRTIAYFEQADVDAWIARQKREPQGAGTHPIERQPPTFAPKFPARFHGVKTRNR